jgi:uncharacterized protein YbaP (TraB family)
MKLNICIRLMGAVLYAMLIHLSPAHAQSTTPDSGSIPVETVLVTGEHPGPGLWKVSRGDHTLWILGTHAPLPAGLVWHSHEVEWVIAESQQILGNYSVSFTLRDANPFDSKGVPLKKVLPRKRFAQWTELKKKYIGPIDEVDTALPVTAALVLRSAAFQRTGLTSADPVSREIALLAASYRVRISTDHQVDQVITSAMLPDDKTSRKVGVDYLINTMDRLEDDLRQARTRANAWATGDIDGLRQQVDADRTAAYLYASSWPFLQGKMLDELLQRADRRWIDAADTALQQNTTTFATLPIFMLLRNDGVLAVLQQQGCDISPPGGDRQDP